MVKSKETEIDRRVVVWRLVVLDCARTIRNLFNILRLSEAHGEAVYIKISEKVKMIALFEGGKVIPKVFRWQNRDYKVKEISLAYQEREGRTVNHYFGIETIDGNVFKLRYNDEQLVWWLEEVWNK